METGSHWTDSTNQFVPQWHQRGFLEPGRSTLAYLDLHPPARTLADGSVIQVRSLLDASTKRCFFRTDLYSTFFGTAVNDEIERKLFGDIDTRGSEAVKAFAETDVTAWHEHFGAFFEYIDIQKLRTPKGLAWLSAQARTVRLSRWLSDDDRHCSLADPKDAPLVGMRSAQGKSNGQMPELFLDAI